MKQQARPRELRTSKSHNGLEKAHSSSDHVYVRVAVLAYSMYEQRRRQDGMISKIGLRQRKRFWKRLRRKTLDAKLARMCD